MLQITIRAKGVKAGTVGTSSSSDYNLFLPGIELLSILSGCAL